jgi:hypothetical protein
VDGSGKVVWKDQSENYTQRSDPHVVRAALSSFTGTSARPNTARS